MCRSETYGCIPIVAFVFNWLGFFAAYCMTRTVAGRYGAISGFGLSVVKWVLILKVSLTIDKRKLQQF